MINRRTLNKAAVVAFSMPWTIGLASSARSVAKAAGGSFEELDTMTVHRHLVYAENELPAFWWLKGRKFGVIDGETKHLWDMSTGIISLGSVLGDGSYDVSVYEAYFQFHPDTEDLMAEWTNPYTNVTDVVPVYSPAVVHHRFTEPVTASESLVRDQVFDSVESIGKPRLLNKTVWQDITKKIAIRPQQNSANAKPFRISENLTYSADLADLEDDYGFRSTRRDLNMWTDWLPNMSMDGYPGGLLSTAQGQKLDTYESLPSSFRHLMDVHFPDVASDPREFVNNARRKAMER